MSSFIRRGYDFVLDSYDLSMAVASGVELRDAREITPASDGDLLLYGGKPDLSHFSDTSDTGCSPPPGTSGLTSTSC